VHIAGLEVGYGEWGDSNHFKANKRITPKEGQSQISKHLPLTLTLKGIFNFPKKLFPSNSGNHNGKNSKSDEKWWQTQ